MLVGGAPLNEEFGSAIGADAYCRDAAVAAETAKSLVAARRCAIGHDRRRSLRRPGGPARGTDGAARRRVLVVACGALVREVRAVLAQLPDVDVDVEYLPANLHNRPERITGAVCAVLDGPTAAGYDHKAVA